MKKNASDLVSLLSLHFAEKNKSDVVPMIKTVQLPETRRERLARKLSKLAVPPTPSAASELLALETKAPHFPFLNTKKNKKNLLALELPHQFMAPALDSSFSLPEPQPEPPVDQYGTANGHDALPLSSSPPSATPPPSLASPFTGLGTLFGTDASQAKTMPIKLKNTKYLLYDGMCNHWFCFGFLFGFVFSFGFGFESGGVFFSGFGVRFGFGLLFFFLSYLYLTIRICS
jgi:hypothetical protein